MHVLSTFIMVADNFMPISLSTLSTLSTFYCGNLLPENTLFSFEKGCAIIQLFQTAAVSAVFRVLPQLSVNGIETKVLK